MPGRRENVQNQGKSPPRPLPRTPTQPAMAHHPRRQHQPTTAHQPRTHPHNPRLGTQPHINHPHPSP